MVTHLILVVVVVAVLITVCDKYLNRRVYDLERQDKNEVDGNYNKTEYMEMMHILAESNIADPNGHNFTLAHFDALPELPSSVMEIGFGLGHFAILLAKRYPSATVIGIDAHQLSVDSANTYLNSLTSAPGNVRFESRRESQLNEERKSVDIITTTMVNHHIFPDEQFVEFLKKVSVVGRTAFIFNDFHRSLKCIIGNDITFLSLKYIGMEKLVQIAQYLPGSLKETLDRYKHIFPKDRLGVDLIADGGMLSMRRSFSQSEYQTLFAQAGYPAEALRCSRGDKWYELMESTCRVVCTVDLTWSN